MSSSLTWVWTASGAALATTKLRQIGRATSPLTRLPLTSQIYCALFLATVFVAHSPTLLVHHPNSFVTSHHLTLFHVTSLTMTDTDKIAKLVDVGETKDIIVSATIPLGSER